MKSVWTVELSLIAGDVDCTESVENQVLEAIQAIQGWDAVEVEAHPAHIERDAT